MNVFFIIRISFFLFLATEAPTSRSWLDVPGIAVSTCVQSVRHRGFRRGGTSFIYAEVTLLKLINYNMITMIIVTNDMNFLRNSTALDGLF